MEGPAIARACPPGGAIYTSIVKGWASGAAGSTASCPFGDTSTAEKHPINNVIIRPTANKARNFTLFISTPPDVFPK
jgi:hypothetical protein